MTKMHVGQKLWHVVAKEGKRKGKTKSFSVLAWDEKGVENIMKVRGYNNMLQCTRMR